jgi:pimeloyl-ACP methyl ester carboxylesterase
VGVLIDVVRVGGLDAWRAARGPHVEPDMPNVPPYVPMGRTVAVGGRDIYLDCRGSGSPTVILESGFSASAGSWGAVLDGVAATTRTCAWDRPGLGRSQSRGPHTGLDVAADLRAALAAAGESGPYVVVAHSLGGVYALLFASTEGSAADEDVVAFVLLDSFEPLVWIADDPELDEAIRVGHVDVLAQTGAMIERGEELQWEATLAELRALPPTEVPTLVLPIEMGRKFGDQAQPVPQAIAAAWYRAVETGYRNARIEIVADSGHVIQFDRPDVVIERTREIVQQLRAAAP